MQGCKSVADTAVLTTHRLMAVVYSADQLLEEIAGFIFREAACLDNAVKQFSSSCIFHHYTQMSRGQKDLQNNRGID